MEEILITAQEKKLYNAFIKYLVCFLVVHSF